MLSKLCDFCDFVDNQLNIKIDLVSIQLNIVSIQFFCVLILINY